MFRLLLLSASPGLPCADHWYVVDTFASGVERGCVGAATMALRGVSAALGAAIRPGSATGGSG